MAAQNDQAKKLSAKVDRQPAVGMTGMGSDTQIHFKEVQKKMDNFFGGKPQTPSPSAHKDQNSLRIPGNHHHQIRKRSPCPSNRCVKIKPPVVELGFRHKH